MRLIYFTMLLAISCLQAWDLKCPEGCGGPLSRSRIEMLYDFEKFQRGIGPSELQIKDFPALTYDPEYEVPYSYCNSYPKLEIIGSIQWELNYHIFDDEDRYKIIRNYFRDPAKKEDRLDPEKIYQLDSFTSYSSVLSEIQSDLEYVYNYNTKGNAESLKWFQSELAKLQNKQKKGVRRIRCHHEDPEDINEFICSYKGYVERQQQSMAEDYILLDSRISEISAIACRIFELHRKMFDHCIEHHSWRGAYYERGLLNYHEGMFEEAFTDILQVIEAAKKSKSEDLLPAETLYSKGLIESELGLYNDAITSLSAVIKKDPSNKDAYFERAVAYFETGEFDEALKDYLASGMRPQMEEKGIAFSLDYASGLKNGIKRGIKEELGDGLPVWAPMMSVGLWALSNAASPYAKIISGTLTCVAAVGAYIAADQITTELRELVTNWNSLTEHERGELTGYLIGKHGIEIFALAGSAKAMKAYQSLKRANNMLNFEMMLIEEGQVASLKNRYKTIEKHRKDKEYVRKYFGKNSYPEQEIRDNLQKMGYQIPEKPAGIPDNFITKYADGCGICYHDPANPNHEYIRLMPGNINSPNPAQQQQYITHYRNGKALDEKGAFVDTKNPKAHIPPEQYSYIPPPKKIKKYDTSL